jgi:hypothetical protein
VQREAFGRNVKNCDPQLLVNQLREREAAAGAVDDDDGLVLP